MRVNAGLLERLARAVVDRGGVAPHDVDVVRYNPLVGDVGAKGRVSEARIKVVMALDLGVHLLRGREVGGVLGERGGEPHPADEANLPRVGHEASHNSGKGTGLLEVHLNRLDLLEGLVVCKVGGGVSVGHEEVDVGV